MFRHIGGNFLFTLLLVLPLTTGLPDYVFQTEKSEPVKFRIQIEKGIPLEGAKIILKDSDPLTGITTDINGEAELRVKSKNTICIIDPVGPYIEFILPESVDSVFLNIRSKKVVFFDNNKRINKTKLNISTPFSRR